jgi:hypothetical protein
MDEKRRQLAEDVNAMFKTPRDVERIDPLLAQIREVWLKFPDMRLGQLLVNLLDPEPNKLFVVEDDVLRDRLVEFLRSGEWPTRSKR